MPATFEVCSCGKHGRVVRGKFRSQEVCTKQWAVHMIRTVHDVRDKMPYKERVTVVQQIEASSIAEEILGPLSAEDQVSGGVEAFNYYGMVYPKEVREWSTDLIHKVVHEVQYVYANLDDLLINVLRIVLASKR